MTEETQATEVQETSNETTSTNDSLLGSLATDNEVKELNERPDFLPETMWDSESNSVRTDELLKGYQEESKKAKGLRQKISEMPGAAKSLDDYSNTLGEVDYSNDGTYQAAKGAALKAGLSAKQLEAFVTEFQLTAGDFIQTKELSNEEIEANRNKEIAKLGDNAGKIIRGVTTWAEDLQSQGIIDSNDKEIMYSMANTAEGLKFFNKLRAITGTSDIPSTPELDDGLPSDSEIAKLIGSREYMDGNPDMLAKVDKLLSAREKAGRPQFLQF